MTPESVPHPLHKYYCEKCVGLRGFQVFYMTSEIVCFHRYLISAFPTPRCPLKATRGGAITVFSALFNPPNAFGTPEGYNGEFYKKKFSSFLYRWPSQRLPRGPKRPQNIKYGNFLVKH